MDTNLEDKPQKKEPYKVLLPVLYTLLALVGAFNICILSYIGCEVVPWLLNPEPAVAQASAQPVTTQQPATQPPATPPPSVAPVAETEAPSDAPDDTTEPPVETQAATDPPAAQTTAPEPSKTPTTPATTAKGKYVGSIQETKYHYPDCQHAERILPENEIWFDTIEEAKADGEGRTACGTCDPR